MLITARENTEKVNNIIRFANTIKWTLEVEVKTVLNLYKVSQELFKRANEENIHLKYRVSELNDLFAEKASDEIEDRMVQKLVCGQIGWIGRNMNISESFEVSGGDTVTFVGAGGKTSTMFRLASEFSSFGLSIVTTTTKIFEWEGKKADFLFISKDIEELEKLISTLPKGRIVTVASGKSKDEKLLGVKPEFADEITTQISPEILVIEGDGASKKSFKAPADYEPVIPASSDLIVPIVGIDVVGETLNSENVHRPKKVCEISHFEIGDTVTPEMIGRVVGHEKGGRKNVPSDASLIPLLNKVDDESKEIAEEVAKKILSYTRQIDKVALGCMIGENPIIKIIER